MKREVPEAPKSAWLLVVGAFVVVAVLLPLVIRTPAPASSTSAATVTSTATGSSAPATATNGTAATSTSSAPSSTQALVLSVLGDAYTAGSGATSPETGFGQLTGQELGWTVTTFGEPGTGYTNPGTGGAVYLDRVQSVIDSKPDVVVVQGSTNDDAATEAQIQSAAAEVFSRLRAGLPDARLFALGALDTPDSVAAVVAVARSAVRSAATAGSAVTFVDPTGWLDPNDGTLFSDGFRASQAGHQRIADRLSAVLTASVTAATASP